MIGPEQPKQEAKDFLTPASFIAAAKEAHPAFRYALAVAGILAIVVTFVKFGVASATLVFGAVAIIGLMVLFLVFAQASKLTKSTLNLPAQVLVWAFLVLTILVAGCLTYSAFFNKPLPFRDWIVQELVKDPRNGAVAPPVPAKEARNGAVVPSMPTPEGPDKNASVEKALILTELNEAYLDTGRKLAFFDDWGRPPARQTLRVNQAVLTGTAADGRVVSMSVDPNQLPTPLHYKSSLAHASSLAINEATEVARFFSSYDQFREALVRLTSNPTDFNGAFINANEFAREATNRGHAALCAMGSTPPRMFPNGGFAEPVPPSCSPGPFSR